MFLTVFAVVRKRVHPGLPMRELRSFRHAMGRLGVAASFLFDFMAVTCRERQNLNMDSNNRVDTDTGCRSTHSPGRMLVRNIRTPARSNPSQRRLRQPQHPRFQARSPLPDCSSGDRSNHADSSVRQSCQAFLL